MLLPEKMEELLQIHLKQSNLVKNPCWKVSQSSLSGRGLFATRDIKQNELIFVDKAVVMGPRCSTKYLPMCINCYKSECPLFPCDGGCGLPVCSDDCQNSLKHQESECKRLQSWKPTSGSMWSMDLLQAVVPIRSLSISPDQRTLVEAFECHEGSQHGKEIVLLENNIASELTAEERNFMLRVCQVFDTNAFETAVRVDNKTSISLRGLYPLGSLQNHSCIPNTRHYFDADGLMYTHSAVFIPKGEELTMTYTDLLWDTQLRRKHLQMSKHFLCQCPRCSDPTELGTNIGALRCASISCFGFMLPDNPLDDKSSWSCRKCNTKVSSRQIESIRSGIRSIINPILSESPRKMLKFTEGELKVLVPDFNYLMMDMKFRIVSYFGRVENLHWKELTDKELEVKSKFCEDLLELLERLELGDCQKKGLILYELYSTKRESASREISAGIAQNTSGTMVKMLDKLMIILQDDIAAPDDLKSLKISTQMS